MIREAKRFYGRRKGHRLSGRQQHLMDTLLPRLSVSVNRPDAAPLQPKSLFPGTVVEIWLEIGFGKGEHLTWQAERHPERGLIGCEPYINGVAALLSAVDRRNLNNIRVFADDARLLLAGLADASIDRVFLLHPDPWPKWRHAKRRFVAADNLDELARVMADGSELRISTDEAGYAAWTLSQMLRRTDFKWLAETAEDWRTPPRDWPETRYEIKARQEGRPPVYLRFRRCPRPN